jgi:hypothetical protein
MCINEKLIGVAINLIGEVKVVGDELICLLVRT